MNLDRETGIVAFSLVAGSMDTVTGALLVAAPGPTLALFGAALPGAAGGEVSMRFVGAFVAGVGASYLWAIGSRDGAVRARRLPGAWGATAVVRGAIALFTTGAVAAGALEPVWLVVGATDAVLAAVQVAVLRAGWLRA